MPPDNRRMWMDLGDTNVPGMLVMTAISHWGLLVTAHQRARRSTTHVLRDPNFLLVRIHIINS